MIHKEMSPEQSKIIDSIVVLAFLLGQTNIASLFLEPLTLKLPLSRRLSEALVLASQKGASDLVELLLKTGVDPNQPDKYGFRPLYVAAQNGHADVVKLLLSNGSDVNKANKNGDTPLYWAAKNGHADVVKLLIAQGANINQANKDGYTPLNWAVYNGYTDIVKLLKNKRIVRKGVKKTKNNSTPNNLEFSR